MEKYFLKQNVDGSPYIDAIYDAGSLAKKDNQAINSTVGSLYDENGSIIAFDSVYKCMDCLDKKAKAPYASNLTGNADFVQAAFDWLNRSSHINLYHKQIATIGGTGALYLAFNSLAEVNSSILLPDIAWSAYKLIAKNANLEVTNYQVVDDNNQINLDDLFEKSEKIMASQGKVVVTINDPAANPTGISLGKQRWQTIINFYNHLAKKGPVIIINDVAYIDYCESSRQYLDCFNDIDENVFVVVAMSFSKTLTTYGSRLGCAVLLSKDQKQLDQVYNYCTRLCRSTWSSPNNVMMKTFVALMNNEKDNYLNELTTYRNLLNERAQIFLTEAKKYKFNILPFSEGFFCFIKCNDPSTVQSKLIEKHIYVVALNKGIRISFCCLSKENCKKLPAIIDEVLNHE